MCGIPLLYEQWDPRTALEEMSLCQRESEAADKNKDLIDDPAKLKTMKKFNRFHESLILYLRTKRGANNIPLAYVIWPVTEVTIGDFEAKYDNKDERYICCAKLK